MLTYSTLSSIAKYPCESIAKNKAFIHRKKFGFFQSEKAAFEDIARHTAMIRVSEEPAIYLRHPFVWLVEAADDICYHIIDLEDAHRLGIIDHHSCIEILKELIASFDRNETDKIQNRLQEITNRNDRVSYLRAKAIYFLTTQCAGIYKDHISDILEGKHYRPLFDIVSADNPAIREIHDFSVENIYNHRSVIEIENAGYNVMYELLSHFILPVIKEKDTRTKAEEKAIRLIPDQFLYEQQDIYSRVLGVIDYVSGMTDNYATDLYRKIKGIDIGMTL